MDPRLAAAALLGLSPAAPPPHITSSGPAAPAPSLASLLDAMAALDGDIECSPPPSDEEDADA